MTEADHVRVLVDETLRKYPGLARLIDDPERPYLRNAVLVLAAAEVVADAPAGLELADMHPAVSQLAAELAWMELKRIKQGLGGFAFLGRPYTEEGDP